MTKPDSVSEMLKNIPMLLGGIFLIYLAVVDETLFSAILMGDSYNRLKVTIATTIAAGVPMFFAVGLIKKGLLINMETIYFYENLLKGKYFWISTIFLLCFISIFVLLQNRLVTFQGIVTVTGSILLSIFLVINTRKMY